MDAHLDLDSDGNLIETVAASSYPRRVHAAGGCIGRGTNGWVQRFGTRWVIKHFRQHTEAEYEKNIALLAACAHLVPIIPLNRNCVIMPRMLRMTTSDARDRCHELVKFIITATRHLFARGLAYTDLTPSNIMIRPGTREFVLADVGSIEVVRPMMPYRSTLWTPVLLRESDVIRGMTHIRAPSLDVLERIGLSFIELIYRWGELRIDLRRWSHAANPSCAALTKLAANWPASASNEWSRPTCSSV